MYKVLQISICIHFVSTSHSIDLSDLVRVCDG